MGMINSAMRAQRQKAGESEKEYPEGSPEDVADDEAEGIKDGSPEDVADDAQENGAPASDELKKFMYVATSILADDKNGVMDQIAKTLSSTQELPKALCDAAYNVTAAVDEKTQGILPDEDMATAAAEILGRIADVAEAAGRKITGKDIAGATNLMIRRFMEENGDVEGLQQMQQADINGVGAQLDQQMQGAQ